MKSTKSVASGTINTQARIRITLSKDEPMEDSDQPLREGDATEYARVTDASHHSVQRHYSVH